MCRSDHPPSVQKLSYPATMQPTRFGVAIDPAAQMPSWFTHPHLAALMRTVSGFRVDIPLDAEMVYIQVAAASSGVRRILQ